MIDYQIDFVLFVRPTFYYFLHTVYLNVGENYYIKSENVSL